MLAVISETENESYIIIIIIIYYLTSCSKGGF